MTLSFPRQMPTAGVMVQEFELRRVDYLSPEVGGRLGAVTAGIPLWTTILTFNNLEQSRADSVRAFIAAQRGAQRQLVAFEILRRRPLFYGAGRPFADSPSDWSQVITDGVAYLTLEGLMAGQVVSLGDYVGFVWEGWKRALVRAVEPSIAGVDGTATFAIEPPVPSLVPATATTTLREASCLMRLITADTRMGTPRRGFVAAGSTISAVQDLVA